MVKVLVKDSQKSTYHNDFLLHSKVGQGPYTNVILPDVQWIIFLSSILVENPHYGHKMLLDAFINVSKKIQNLI